jgi:cytochrome c biogenesis protein CcmG, thiol:disulfide interchange protein DsbE
LEAVEDRYSARLSIEADRAVESIRSATVCGVKRALIWIVGVLMLTTVVVVGLVQAGDDSEEPAAPAAQFDLEQARASLDGAPAPLAALHEQSAQLLDGGVPAFERRLAELKGSPVVINKWASWCGPCRSEFPVFQQVGTERGKEIAFLGLNSGDSTAPARKFLAEYPVPFPSYLDPDEKIARKVSAPANYPITVFVDARGKIAFIHQGPYERPQDLEADIDRYAAA